MAVGSQSEIEADYTLQLRADPSFDLLRSDTDGVEVISGNRVEDINDLSFCR